MRRYLKHNAVIRKRIARSARNITGSSGMGAEMSVRRLGDYWPSGLLSFYFWRIRLRYLRSRPLS